MKTDIDNLILDAISIVDDNTVIEFVHKGNDYRNPCMQLSLQIYYWDEESNEFEFKDMCDYTEKERELFLKVMNFDNDVLCEDKEDEIIFTPATFQGKYLSQGFVSNKEGTIQHFLPKSK